jgi:hypothetical protein
MAVQSLGNSMSPGGEGGREAGGSLSSVFSLQYDVLQLLGEGGQAREQLKERGG